MKWHRIEALLIKYYYISVNRLDRIFDIFYWPLMGMLLWGFTTYFIRDISDNSQILNIFIGGIILWTFYQRAMQDIGVYVLEDFWSRNLTNLLATPLQTSEYVAGVIILGFLRSLLTFIFLGLLGFLFYSFNIFSGGILVVVLFSIVLLLFGWFFGLFVASLIFRYGQKIQVFAWSVAWLIQPFSAVFYPLSSVPVWLQKISLLFPSTYAFEGMRHAFVTGEILWKNFWIALVIDVVLLIGAYLFFLRSVNVAKKTGLLTKME